jgi:hypothetical protein
MYQAQDIGVRDSLLNTSHEDRMIHMVKKGFDYHQLVVIKVITSLRLSPVKTIEAYYAVIRFF